ncbi:MAG: superoxide dismutase family protein [Vicinamibacterales bacterium]
MQRMLSSLALSGCLLATAALAAAQTPMTAKAELKNANGEVVGHATLTETPHGVLIRTELTKVPPGVHAFHIHAVGKCEPPFTSAGGHFNPAGKQHGIKNPQGMHAGDMPNIEVPSSGMLTFEKLDQAVTLGSGSNSLFDADGSALMLHEHGDDYTSDPAGDAGSRIACGVITK